MVLVGKKTYEQMAYLSAIYSAYTFFKCRFRADNVQAMWAEQSEVDRRLFDFDLDRIDWDEYVDHVHIPGLRKFVLKGRNTV